MRVATGGLAASDRITPVNISTRIAPSNSLSTVHHHSEKGVRSSRESMGGRFRTEISPLVAEVGYRRVNESFKFRRVSYPGRSAASLDGALQSRGPAASGSR